MKKIFSGFKMLTLLIALACLIITGCDHPVTNLANQSQQAKQRIGGAELVIKADILKLVIPKANSRSLSGTVPTIAAAVTTPADITKVTVTLTGENIKDTIVYDLVKVDEIWQGIIGNIPAGPTHISIRGYDSANNLIYEQSSNVEVVNHQSININLILEPINIPNEYDVKAPRIERVTISPQKVAPLDQVALYAYAVDPAPSGPLSYIWTPQNTGTFNNRMIANPIWTAPAEEGIYQLTVTVIDQEFLLDHYSIFVEVSKKYGSGNVPIIIGTNDYPEIYSIVADPTRIDKGESTQLTVDAVDPDDDPLTYSWSADRPGIFSDPTIPDPVFTIDEAADYGICTITVVVSDGTLQSTGLITINISQNPHINVAPEIINIFQSAVRASKNGNIILIVKAKDPEGTALSFRWVAPAGTFSNQVDSNNGTYFQSQIVWKAPATGSPTAIVLSVEVTDADGLTKKMDFIPVTVLAQ